MRLWPFRGTWQRSDLGGIALTRHGRVVPRRIRQRRKRNTQTINQRRLTPMNEKIDRTIQILPWLIVLALGAVLTFEVYGTDRYKIQFGTYTTPITGSRYVYQGGMRIDSKTGRTWALVTERTDGKVNATDVKWVEVFDLQAPQR